jgi:Z1 domain/Type III restriction enzyme, res subunit
MTGTFDINALKAKIKKPTRYELQLARIAKEGKGTGCIEQAVTGTLGNLTKLNAGSLVIYGEPQSGKTEMMICLTAALLDQGHRFVIHLVNDNLDLLSQNKKRFQLAKLPPAPKTAAELAASNVDPKTQDVVVFSTKNAKHLKRVIERIEGLKNVVVIDDEADYATPNSKIKKGGKTKINELVEALIGSDGYYIGVTATPARLNLNETLGNKSEHWVRFPPHEKYTGQDVFFPMKGPVAYKLVFLQPQNIEEQARDALLRFFVRSAYLNKFGGEGLPDNYGYLVHTSHKKDAHEADRIEIEKTVSIISNQNDPKFAEIMKRVFDLSNELYPEFDASIVMEFVAQHAALTSIVVLNSERDRKAAGENPTEPTSPFTIYIGGNIVSRGVTFGNLLGMYFTRGVQSKLQQDTYIQRARMFGDRGEYLKHFELAIPSTLYAEWRRCFVYHRLALLSIEDNKKSPIWIGDGRIAVVASASISASVTVNRGEMSFPMFDFTPEVATLLSSSAQGPVPLEALKGLVGPEAMPSFLIELTKTLSPDDDIENSIVLHFASDISGQSAASGTDHENISRPKGFMGQSQLETKKFPKAIHHIKVFYNSKKKARVFYKLAGKEMLQLK